MILRQRQRCTFVGGHEVLSLVFAVVEAAGEDQVIIVTLEEDSVRGAIGQEGAPCRGGTVYVYSVSGVLVRVTSQSPSPT